MSHSTLGSRCTVMVGSSGGVRHLSCGTDHAGVRLTRVHGNSASAVISNQCAVQVFGMLGLLIADLCLNFGSISYPAYRILSLLVYAVMWLISSFRGGSSGVNHVAHVIGLIVGATWGSLYLPSLPTELMELASPCAGVTFLSLH